MTSFDETRITKTHDKMKPKNQNCIIKGPFIKAINENGLYFTTDKNAICSQCKKPFKKHKEWK